ncbi:MAG: hypothetical protein K6U74_19910 [Firmicutes bacterium]|nr:hypothetical protein [Bacillota bacterium]
MRVLEGAYKDWFLIDPGYLIIKARSRENMVNREPAMNRGVKGKPVLKAFLIPQRVHGGPHALNDLELTTEGPLPSLLAQQGMDGALPPQMEEQSVALEMIILSPNNRVTSLA